MIHINYGPFFSDINVEIDGLTFRVDYCAVAGEVEVQSVCYIGGDVIGWNPQELSDAYYTNACEKAVQQLRAR